MDGSWAVLCVFRLWGLGLPAVARKDAASGSGAFRRGDGCGRLQ